MSLSHLLCIETKAGGLACLCQWDMIYMEIGTGLVVLGKDTLTDLPSLIDGAFREQDDNLPELHIRALAYQIRYTQVGAQLSLQFLGLDLQTARTDNVVLATKDAEALWRQFGDVIGNQSFRTHLRRINHQTVILRQTNPHGGEGRRIRGTDSVLISK